MATTDPRLDLADAIDVLRAGGVIAYPTEGVWGLGCDPFNQAAVERVLAIKQRDVAKGLILIASRIGQLAGIADWAALPPAHRAAVEGTWPGHHTWVVPALARVPAWVRGAHDSVAVRVTDHPDVIALCDGFGGALVSTSANTSGMPAVSTADALEQAVRDAVDGVLAGDTLGRAGASSIRDARDLHSLR